MVRWGPREAKAIAYNEAMFIITKEKFSKFVRTEN